jgi:hypothetical protein
MKQTLFLAVFIWFAAVAPAQTLLPSPNVDPKAYTYNSMAEALSQHHEEGSKFSVMENGIASEYTYVDTTKGFSPDGGVIISAPNTKWAAARMLPDGIVHSRWFAKGDSVTNDRIAIQTMLSKYKHVQFDKGYKYRIKDTTLFITLDNQLIESDGATIIQDLADSSRNVFVVQGAKHVTFNGLTIIGSVGLGIAVGNYANGRAGIQFEPGASFGTVQNCLIRKQTPLQFRASSHINVDHNHLYFTQTGVMAWADSAQSISDVNFTFNYVHVDTLGGIVSTNFLVRGLKTQNAYDVKAVGNTVLGAQLSIEFFFYNPTNKATNYIVTNNIADTYVSLSFRL